MPGFWLTVSSATQNTHRPNVRPNLLRLCMPWSMGNADEGQISVYKYWTMLS